MVLATTRTICRRATESYSFGMPIAAETRYSHGGWNAAGDSKNDV